MVYLSLGKTISNLSSSQYENSTTIYFAMFSFFFVFLFFFSAANGVQMKFNHFDSLFLSNNPYIKRAEC